jgi:cytoskeletal protein CcmA (bactofilin family)/DNA-directed RNA polymerase subunit RPC12/RpoP
MAAKQPDKTPVACPHCGHQQPESRLAFSTICRQCGRHFHVQTALNPPPKAPDRTPAKRQVVCFDCGAGLDVPVSAESTMCKRCGRYVDLHDYRVATAVSRNFKTRGTFVVEPKGYVFNTETIARAVVIKGRFHGRLVAEESLTVYSSAEIKGSLKTAQLIIPEGNHFRWPDCLQVETAEIAGELAGTLHVTGTATLRSTARWFGDLVAGQLVAEEGAVVVGTMRIGRPQR